VYRRHQDRDAAPTGRPSIIESSRDGQFSSYLPVRPLHIGCPLGDVRYFFLVLITKFNLQKRNCIKYINLSNERTDANRNNLWLVPVSKRLVCTQPMPINYVLVSGKIVSHSHRQRG
jgi:hypothetical protein